MLPSAPSPPAGAHAAQGAASAARRPAARRSRATARRRWRVPRRRDLSTTTQAGASEGPCCWGARALPCCTVCQLCWAGLRRVVFGLPGQRSWKGCCRARADLRTGSPSLHALNNPAVSLAPRAAGASMLALDSPPCAAPVAPPPPPITPHAPPQPPAPFPAGASRASASRSPAPRFSTWRRPLGR